LAKDVNYKDKVERGRERELRENVKVSEGKREDK